MFQQQKLTSQNLARSVPQTHDSYIRFHRSHEHVLQNTSFFAFLLNKPSHLYDSGHLLEPPLPRAVRQVDSCRPVQVRHRRVRMVRGDALVSATDPALLRPVGRHILCVCQNHGTSVMHLTCGKLSACDRLLPVHRHVAQ